MSILVVGKGNVFANLVLVGEAPGAQEDIEGKPFVGKSGKFLDHLLTKAGFDVDKDIYFCNVIKCRPPNNRKPTLNEIEVHKPWLMQQIKLVNPELVLLAGSTAMKTILDIKDPISEIRGKFINKEGIEFITIFHPSYLMRFSTKKGNNPSGLTLKDLLNVRKKLYDL